MAGYSGKSLTQKLGIKPGFTLAVIDPPTDYQELLQPLPEGVRFCGPSEKPHLIHYFCTERVRLARELPRLRKTMREDAILWVSWPKKNSFIPTTVTEDVVREFALPLGLVDNKICAMDENLVGGPSRRAARQSPSRRHPPALTRPPQIGFNRN